MVLRSGSSSYFWSKFKTGTAIKVHTIAKMATKQPAPSGSEESLISSVIRKKHKLLITAKRAIPATPTKTYSEQKWPVSTYNLLYAFRRLLYALMRPTLSHSDSGNSDLHLSTRSSNCFPVWLTAPLVAWVWLKKLAGLSSCLTLGIWRSVTLRPWVVRRRSESFRVSRILRKGWRSSRIWRLPGREIRYGEFCSEWYLLMQVVQRNFAFFHPLPPTVNNTIKANNYWAIFEFSLLEIAPFYSLQKSSPNLDIIL